MQSNKLNKALSLFDIIQTVDSFKLAHKMNQRLKYLNKREIGIIAGPHMDPKIQNFSEDIVGQVKKSLIITMNPSLQKTNNFRFKQQQEKLAAKRTATSVRPQRLVVSPKPAWMLCVRTQEFSM